MSESALRRVLRLMLEELEAHQLTVVLAPAPRPHHECHCIRVAIDKNPRWYSRLYSRNPVIKRACVLSCLRNYLATGTTRFIRFDEIIAEAKKYRKSSGQLNPNPF